MVAMAGQDLPSSGLAAGLAGDGGLTRRRRIRSRMASTDPRPFAVFGGIAQFSLRQMADFRHCDVPSIPSCQIDLTLRMSSIISSSVARYSTFDSPGKRRACMNAMEKVARTELVGLGRAVALATALIPWLGTASAAAFGLLGLLGLTIVFVRRRGNQVVVDERDREIDRRAGGWASGPRG